MSNNHLLKSKESNKHNEHNNRFSSLQDDDKSSFKWHSNKSNCKNIKYEASQNSFKQQYFKPQKNRDQDSIFNIRNDKFNKFTNYKPREPSPLPGPDTTDINLFPNLFPNLTQMKENITTYKVEAGTKFKDILNSVVEKDKPKENPIPSGWVKLSSVDGKTVIEHCPTTQLTLKTQLDDDLNYLMFQAIEKMKQNSKRYELEYDEINGEGAYAERFSIPPVYETEYDTERMRVCVRARARVRARVLICQN